MSNIDSTNFIIQFIIRIIDFIHPIHRDNDIINQHNTTNTQGQVQRRNRRRNRQYNRYRRINLGNNHTRGCIILRA